MSCVTNEIVIPEPKMVGKTKPSKDAKKKLKQEKKVVNSLLKQEIKKTRVSTQSKMKNGMASKQILKRNPMLERLLMTLVLPGMDTTQRWSSPFSSKKTAVAEPFAIIPANFGQSTSSSPSGYINQMLNTEFASFLFRNPLRAAIIYDQNSAGLPCSYAAAFDQSGAQPSFATPTIKVNGPNPIDYYPEISYMAFASAYTPHGNIYFPGSVNGRSGKFIWLDAGTVITMNVVITSVSTTVSATFQLDSYDNEGIHPNVTSITSMSSSTFNMSLTIATGAYFCPHVTLFNTTYATTAAANVILELTTSDSGTSHFCQLCIPGLSTNLGAVKGIRMTGLSLMYTNTSAEIQLGGTISAFQAGTDDNWMNYVTTASSGSLSLVSSVADSVTMNASRGCYGFLKPTDPRDFDFKDDLVTSGSNQPIDSSFALDSNDSFMVIIMNNPNPVGCAGYHTLRFAIEYLTNDPWRSTGISYVDENLASQAIARVRDFKQFHENPLHWADIWSGIKSAVKSVASAVADYGPIAVSMAKMLI